MLIIHSYRGLSDHIFPTKNPSSGAGRCHAFVKTEHDLDHIAASETWMSCLGSSGGDPDSQVPWGPGPPR